MTMVNNWTWQNCWASKSMFLATCHCWVKLDVLKLKLQIPEKTLRDTGRVLQVVDPRIFRRRQWFDWLSGRTTVDHRTRLRTFRKQNAFYEQSDVISDRNVLKTVKVFKIYSTFYSTNYLDKNWREASKMIQRNVYFFDLWGEQFYPGWSKCFPNLQAPYGYPIGNIFYTTQWRRFH